MWLFGDRLKGQKRRINNLLLRLLALKSSLSGYVWFRIQFNLVIFLDKSDALLHRMFWKKNSEISILPKKDEFKRLKSRCKIVFSIEKFSKNFLNFLKFLQNKKLKTNSHPLSHCWTTFDHIWSYAFRKASIFSKK